MRLAGNEASKRVPLKGWRVAAGAWRKASKGLHALVAVVLMLAPGGLGALEETTFSRPVRILPLGDSITQAWADTSYRYPLWRRCLEHGVEVDFVGTRDDSSELSSAERPAVYLGRRYDGNHEGHWGWTADEVLAQLDEWLPNYPAPDITLIHLGTNDSFRGQPDWQTRLDVSAIVRRLKQHRPGMIIVVAKIFPGFWGDVRRLNAELASIPGVLVADCYTGIDLATDTVDRAHPNASGGEKMAAAWWEVLQPVLGPWRQTFTRWSEAHPLPLTESADTDGDGWVDYLEFGARTDPLSPASTPRLRWENGRWQAPFDPLRTAGRLRLLQAASPADLASAASPGSDRTEGSGGLIEGVQDAPFLRWEILPPETGP